jgi:hypothetical protein
VWGSPAVAVGRCGGDGRAAAAFADAVMVAAAEARRWRHEELLGTSE